MTTQGSCDLVKNQSETAAGGSVPPTGPMSRVLSAFADWWRAAAPAALRENFHRKYGASDAMGWGPKLRLQFGYFNPDDIYETTVAWLVNADTEWLDVGCGRDIFPSNFATARLLAERCRLLVGLDPSDNIDENELVHERFKGFLEEFPQDRQFDLVTLRMVAEHITNPEEAVAVLSNVCRTGGRVVLYTVSKWSPVTLLSSALPFRFHHRIKSLFWRTEEKDTFPTAYLMNSRRDLRKLFRSAGFTEEDFHYLDDCRTLARWKFTNTLELLFWKMLSTIGLHYPEVCLLGIYRKDSPSFSEECAKPRLLRSGRD